jgi:phosphonate transport system permease protein
MVVVSMGFTNTAATVGLVISTVGYLTKSFIASIEDAGIHSSEAMRATGANWLLIIFKGLMPTVISPFLSWTAIRFERSIAESVSLGMLGVAGIGLLLIQASRNYEFGRVSVIVLVVVAFMVIVEIPVNRVRRRLQDGQ